MTDELLVMRTLNGDKGAFAVIVEKYKNTVFAITLKILHHYEDAEDAAQEVFLSAYQNLDKLKEPEKLRAWLCRIAKYRCYRELRRRHDVEDIEELPDTLMSEDGTPEDRAILSEDIQMLMSGLSSLPEHLRVTISLRYLHGLSTAETARKLEIPEGTVKSRLSLGIAKLRKEVFGMTDNEKKTTSENFTAKVMSAVLSLRRYTVTPDFNGKYKEVMALLDTMPDSEKKDELKAEALRYRSWTAGGTLSEEEKNFIKEKGGAQEISNETFDRYCAAWNKSAAEKRKILEDGLEKVMVLDSKTEEGSLRFWIGRTYLDEKNYDTALSYFKKATELLPHEEAYYPNALAAIAVAEKLKNAPKAENVEYCYSACGETVTAIDGKLWFSAQPGFSDGYSDACRYDSVFYYASRVDMLFYDEKLSIGDSIRGKDGSIMTCISKDRTVETEAGVFENCTVFYHDIHSKYHNAYTAEVTYKQGIGLVKVQFADDGGEEVYELTDYHIAGGTGLMPLAVGNRWHYRNPMLPSNIAGEIEKAVAFFDKDYAGIISWEWIAVDNNLENYADVDAFAYIERADRICDSMKRTDPYDAEKVEKARKDFCRAMQIATKPFDAILAEAGLDHLNKRASYMRAGYRLLPSSVSLQEIVRKDGKLDLRYRYQISPFYDLGRRGIDNKIWGMKVYRYLDEMCGTLFDPRWQEAAEKGEVFTEVKNEGDPDEEIRIEAKRYGTVVTKAGIFRNCIVVTIEKGKQDESYAYYWNNSKGYYTRGKKTFFFAPDVGIVKFDCKWGTTRDSSLQLASYKSVSTDGSYMPFYYGMEWHYEEVTFCEKYVAEVNIRAAGGTADRVLLTYEQNVYYAASEEEYEAARNLLSSL